MKFSITRLCGGKALMAAPADDLHLDLDKASKLLSDEFVIKKNDSGMMLIMEWKGMEVTLYSQGKVMFHPLSDKKDAIEYATMILTKVK